MTSFVLVGKPGSGFKEAGFFGPLDRPTIQFDLLLENGVGRAFGLFSRVPFAGKPSHQPKLTGLVPPSMAASLAPWADLWVPIFRFFAPKASQQLRISHGATVTYVDSKVNLH